MASSAEFSLEVFPLVTVLNVEQAAVVTKNDYDVLITSVPDYFVRLVTAVMVC